MWEIGGRKMRLVGGSQVWGALGFLVPCSYLTSDSSCRTEQDAIVSVSAACIRMPRCDYRISNIASSSFVSLSALSLTSLISQKISTGVIRPSGLMVKAPDFGVSSSSGDWEFESSLGRQ